MNSAIGLSLYNNVIGEGNLFRQDVNLSYTYQWKMTQKENSPILAFGLESGFSGRVINAPSRSYEIWNPISRSFANLNMGIHFYLPQEKFYIGASVSDILQTDVISNPTYLPFYQLMSGYRFGLGKKFFLQPNMLLKITSQYRDFNTNLQLQHAKWEAGIGYVFAHPYTPLDYIHNRYLTLNAGVCIKKRFYIRYLYDYSLSALSNSISQSSHSMMISYRSLK